MRSNDEHEEFPPTLDGPVATPAITGAAIVATAYLGTQMGAPHPVAVLLAGVVGVLIFDLMPRVFRSPNQIADRLSRVVDRQSQFRMIAGVTLAVLLTISAGRGAAVRNEVRAISDSFELRVRAESERQALRRRAEEIADLQRSNHEQLDNEIALIERFLAEAEQRVNDASDSAESMLRITKSYGHLFEEEKQERKEISVRLEAVVSGLDALTNELAKVRATVGVHESRLNDIERQIEAISDALTNLQESVDKNIRRHEQSKVERSKLLTSMRNLRGEVRELADSPDLRGSNLSGLNLKGALLKKANLSNSNLSRVRLRKAVMHQARLDSSDLSHADLRGASCIRCSFLEANLQGASLRDAMLVGAYFGGSNLSGADLRGATIKAAKWKGALYNSRTRFPTGFRPREHGLRRAGVGGGPRE